MSDLYQDLACRGGVPDTGFLNFWWHTEVHPALNNTLEEFIDTEDAIPPEILDVHPLYNDYWKAKAPPLKNINVPMLLCASFSDHELHTFGSFRAYEKAQSAQKWLYTHRSGKWTEFYKPEVKNLIKDFMDHFLKGEPTQFRELSTVRIEVRSSLNDVREVRWEPEWPLRDTKYVELYLRKNNALAPESIKDQREVVYDGKKGQASFDYVFEQDTEITGYIKLKIWVESRGVKKSATPPDDMVFCCFIDKRDQNNRSVRFNGSVGQKEDMVTRGYGRAARRELNDVESTPYHPVLLGEKHQPLQPGAIVPIEIAFCPSSTFYAKGERLRLFISARDLVSAPIFKKDTSVNGGHHVIHFGGEFDSHLLIPSLRK